MEEIANAMAPARREGALRRFVAWSRLDLNDVRAEVAACVLLCPLLLVVALWNGFPIIFYDTGAYLLQGLGHVFIAERSPVYSFFLLFAGAGLSLWLIVILQAAMCAFVMVETARTVAPRFSLAGLLTLAGALVLLTGLPWYVGQMQPDCFTGLVVLCVNLLAFHSRNLGGARRPLLMAVATLATAVHTSDLLLCSGLLVAIVVYRSVRNGWPLGAWPRADLRHAALSCIMAVGLVVAGNAALTGGLFVSRAGPAFVFARLLQDRIVMRLLDDHCADAHYRLCAYKDVLPRTADQWLWGRDSPFLKLGRFSGTSAESTRMIWDSIRHYPALQVETVLSDSARQFVTFKTGDQIEPQEWILAHTFDQFVPQQLPAYLHARQQRGEIDFRPINAVHVTVGWISLCGLAIAIVLAFYRRRPADALLIVLVLVALVANAVICGALSNPHARYQSRVLWLVPFLLVLIEANRPLFFLRRQGESGSN